MNINTPQDSKFTTYYHKHIQCLKLAGMQPKTIETYSRAIRRIANYFGLFSELVGAKKVFKREIS